MSSEQQSSSAQEEIDKVPEEDSGTENAGGVTRRQALKYLGLLATCLAIPGSDGQRSIEQQKAGDDLQGLVARLQEMLQGPGPASLAAQRYNYTNVLGSIRHLEESLRQSVGKEQGQKGDVQRAQYLVNILRLLFETLSSGRKEQITRLSGPHAAENAATQKEQEDLSVLLEVELHHFTSVVHHMRMMGDVFRATTDVPQMRKGKGTPDQDAYLQTVYKDINAQVSDRLAAPLEVLRLQMRDMEAHVKLQEFIVTALAALGNGGNVGADTLIDLQRMLSPLRGVKLLRKQGEASAQPQGDVARAMELYIQRPGQDSIAKLQQALHALRLAVMYSLETIVNDQKGYLDVELITHSEVAMFKEVDEFKANVSLVPSQKKGAKEGRLATVVFAAASIERMRALHQEVFKLQANRGDPQFAAKQEALVEAYDQEMDRFLRGQQHSMQDIGWRREITALSGASLPIADREYDVATPADTPELRAQRAAGEKVLLAEFRRRLDAKPEERQKLQEAVLAWRADGYRVESTKPGQPLTEAYAQVVAAVGRVLPELTRNAAASEQAQRHFSERLRRFLSQVGMGHVPLGEPGPDLRTEHLRRRKDYANGLVASAKECMALTDKEKLTSQEGWEAFLNPTLLRFNTKKLAERSVTQQATLPIELEVAYWWPIKYVHWLAISHWLGVDLREVYKENGTYLGYSVKLPAVRTLLLMGNKLDAALAKEGLTKQQLQDLSPDEQKQVVAKLAEHLENEETTTVAEVKARHQPAMDAAGSMVVAASNTLQAAGEDPRIAEPGSFFVEGRYMDGKLPDVLRGQAGNVHVVDALSNLRIRLGNQPFDALHEACDRRDEGLTNYRDVLRQPAGDWWKGPDGEPDAARVAAALKQPELQLSPEESLWLYVKLLPALQAVNVPQENLLQAMRDLTAKMKSLEQKLDDPRAGLTPKQREDAVEELFRTRGQLRGMWMYIAAHERFAQDRLTFEYGDYMSDQSKALGQHMSVASMLLTLGDHRTAALTLLAMRGVEIAVTVKVGIELVKAGVKRLIFGKKKDAKDSGAKRVTDSEEARKDGVRQAISSQQTILDALHADCRAAAQACRASQGTPKEPDALRAVQSIILRIIAALDNMVELAKSIGEVPEEFVRMRSQMEEYAGQYGNALRALESAQSADPTETPDDLEPPSDDQPTA